MTIMPAAPRNLPEWVTVRHAAEIAHRKVRTIYDWIDQGRIASKQEDGVLLVLAKTADRLGQEVTRGRPKGT
jgi:hypothetical protein